MRATRRRFARSRKDLLVARRCSASAGIAGRSPVAAAAVGLVGGVAASTTGQPGPAGGVAASTTDQPGAATLTALAVAGTGSGSTRTSLELGDRVDVLLQDRIAIDQKGRGLLRFQDTLSVELFHDTQMEIGATHVDRNGDALVNLKQNFGHSAIDLKAQARQRVEWTLTSPLSQPLATIRS